MAARRVGSEAEITVHDNGIGIGIGLADAELTRILGMFSRVEEATAQQRRRGRHWRLWRPGYRLGLGQRLR